MLLGSQGLCAYCNIDLHDTLELVTKYQISTLTNVAREERNMSWVPKHPDTIHNYAPVPPTALWELADMCMHRRKTSRGLLFPSTLQI